MENIFIEIHIHNAWNQVKTTSIFFVSEPKDFIRNCKYTKQCDSMPGYGWTQF